MQSGKKRFNKLPKNKFTQALKGVAVYVLIALAALIFFANLSGGSNVGNQVPLSQVLNDVRENKVEKIDVEGDKVIVDYKDSDKIAEARKEPGESIYQTLKNADVDTKNVAIEVKDISWQQNWLGLLGTILPIALMIGFFFLIFRQAREG